MSRIKRDWIAQRQNWSRPQQKERIILWFKVRSEKGDFSHATAQQIANGLHMISVQAMKEICEEMVDDHILHRLTTVHRTRKDGSQLMKSLYCPYLVEEWEDAFTEQEFLTQSQLTWFDPERNPDSSF